MTISRTRERNIYFECDAKRCANVCDTQLDDFAEALEEAKEQGWSIRKEGNDWKHYCPDETAADLEELRNL